MIDDQASYTKGLAVAFGFEDGLDVVGRETSATNGVEVVFELQPDLVLCDYRMPGESNGIDCAARLRKNGYSGEIVILTGFAAPHIQSEAALLDDVRVISKDLPLVDIIETVSAASAPSTPAPESEWNLDDYILEKIALAESPTSAMSPHRSRKTIITTAAAAAALAAGFLLLSGPGQQITAPSGIGLERPFIVVDGTASEVRVTVEVDGVANESFIPSNLPITVAIDTNTPNTDIQVTVENLDTSGTASCSIGVSKEVLVSHTAATKTNAVCATTLK